MQGGPQIVPRSVLGIVRLLIDSSANVNTSDGEGWSPLHIASRNGHRDIAELLLESGASLDGIECGNLLSLQSEEIALVGPLVVSV